MGSAHPNPHFSFVSAASRGYGCGPTSRNVHVEPLGVLILMHFYINRVVLIITLSCKGHTYYDGSDIIGSTILVSACDQSFHTLLRIMLLNNGAQFIFCNESPQAIGAKK